MILRNYLNLSKPPFPHLPNGDNSIISSEVFLKIIEFFAYRCQADASKNSVVGLLFVVVIVIKKDMNKV